MDSGSATIGERDRGIEAEAFRFASFASRLIGSELSGMPSGYRPEQLGAYVGRGGPGRAREGLLSE